jgi:hypothetical protein
MNPEARGLLLAADADLPDPSDLRDFLHQDVFGINVDGGQRYRIGSEGEHQDRRVRPVDLADRRRVGRVLRQLALSCIDRGENLRDRAVNAAAELELQIDGGFAERTRRCHLGEAGICPNCSSSGLATVEAIVCRSAPGNWAVTLIVG